MDILENKELSMKYFMFLCMSIALLGCDNERPKNYPKDGGGGGSAGGGNIQSGVFKKSKSLDPSNIEQEKLSPKCLNKKILDDRIKVGLEIKTRKIMNNIFGDSTKKLMHKTVLFDLTSNAKVIQVANNGFIAEEQISGSFKDKIHLSEELVYNHFFNTDNAKSNLHYWDSELVSTSSKEISSGGNIVVDCGPFDSNDNGKEAEKSKFEKGHYVLKSGKKIPSIRTSFKTQYKKFVCKYTDEKGKTKEMTFKDMIVSFEEITTNTIPNLDESCERTYLFQKSTKQRVNGPVIDFFQRELLAYK